MAVGLWVFAVALLVLAAVAVGWLLHDRGRRLHNSPAVAVTPMPVAQPAVESAERSESDLSASAANQPSRLSEREVLVRLHAIAFEGGVAGKAQADPEDPAHAKVIRFADAELSRLGPGSRHAPRRPLLLPRLLRAVNSGDSSGREIAAIIAEDPALAGNLLRIANSALYRVRREPIESIERAVVMIGTDGVRHLIAVALMQPVLGGGHGLFDRIAGIIWQHGLLAAATAAMYARQVERGDAFKAQILGLLHGLGAITVVRTARDAYAQQRPLLPVPGAIALLLERWTAPFACRLAEGWGLSTDIAEALHDQQRKLAPNDLTTLGRSLRVGRATGAAAMLHGRGEIDADAAMDLVQRLGWRGDVAEEVWARLTESTMETVPL